MTPPRDVVDRSSSASPTAAWLRRIRAAGRGLLVLQRTGWVLGWMLAILLVAGTADYVLRTPAALRAGLWVIGAGVLAGVLRRTVWPAIRFHPPLTEVALRIENSPAGQRAGLGSMLAAGLELERAGEGSSMRGRMAEPVIAEARRRLSTVSAASVLAPARTLRSLGWLGLVVAGIATVGMLEPELSRIGASRLLWPLGGAQWPKRTAVADVTGVKVHPLGTALALRAAVKTSGSPENTRVAANYRTITETPGGPFVQGPVRRVLLTPQDRLVLLGDQRAPVDSADANARQLFERLLEPAGLQLDMGAPRRPDQPSTSEITLEYWFETEDDRTTPARLLLVEPPAVRSATASVLLPDYALPVADRFSDLKPGGVIELGAGNDERAAAPAVLAGSRLTVAIDLNKAVPGLSPGSDIGAFAKRCLGPDAAALLASDSGASLVTSDRTWTLSWTIDQPVRLTVRATDSHGITGVEDSTFRFEPLRDNPPSAVITAPTEDKSVLATAVVELAAEARDDVGLEWLTLERQVARKPQGSEGAPAEPRGEREAFARVEPASGSPDARRLASSTSLDLSALEVQPGDEVWISAAAADIYRLDGARHDVARSGIRRLRIMSREELVQQVWSELGAVRRTAVKIDEDQRDLRRSSERPGAEEARRAERAQAAVTERINRQRAAIDQLRERIRENALTDQTLSDVIGESDRLLARAGEESAAASEALNRAEKAESAQEPDPQAAQDQRRQAGQSQEGVREQLARLIDLLDQGEDTYAARRALEQLLQQQKSLQSRTEQAGRSTTGKSAERLSPQEQQELQKLAQEQNDAAERLKDAIEKMLQREQKLEKNDAAAAQQMAQAARRGQREQAEKKMREAAQQVAQNQTNIAQQSQQQAIQSLEQMLKELDKAAQARDEVLRRYLASLMDSLRGLIRQQEERLAELDAAVPGGPFKGLDAGMARLHRATLGVLDEARGAPRDAAGVLALVDRAADAQAAAVVGLRDDPVNHEEVRGQEQLSLDKLNEALEAAEQLDQDAQEREQDRKRQELRQRYLEALKDQTGIRDSTLGLVGVEPTRRTRDSARRLGQEQETLRASLEALRTETKELRDARLFDYAHTRLNDLMGGAAAELGEGSATDRTTRRQAGAARVLASLAEALDDRNRDDRKYREREQQQGGGGGSGNDQPLVPPAAELKLLRLLQQEAAERTRSTAESPSTDAAAVGEVSRMQRELADQARELLERLSRRGRGGPSPEVDPADAPPGLRPAPDQPPVEPDQPEGHS